MLECICIRDRFQIQLGRSKVSIKPACFHLTKRWLACLPALWIKILQNSLCIGCAQRILAGKICWGSASLKRKTFSPSWKSRETMIATTPLKILKIWKIFFKKGPRSLHSQNKILWKATKWIDERFNYVNFMHLKSNNWNSTFDIW